MAERIRLGELLVDAKVITRQQLDAMLEKQRQDGRRLGTLLSEAGLVSEVQVTQILSQQLAVPWVSLYHIDFSRQLLNLVPREVAERYCLVPIFVRRVRGVGEMLYVAMDDPSDEAARDEVARFAGLPVRAMIAAPSDIRAAIRAYYSRPSSLAPGGPSASPPAEDDGPSPEVATAPPRDEPPAARVAGVVGGESAPLVVETPSRESREVVPDPTAPRPELDRALGGAQGSAAASTAAARADHAVGGGPAGAAPPTVGRAQALGPLLGAAAAGEEPAPDSGVPVPVREPTMPHPRGGSRPRMITLTLLDGTHVTLPARPSRGDSAPPSERTVTSLTARDLVSALCAATQGADARDVLGETAQWEPLFAALLSLLLKKHLIADWEFVEELERIKQG